MPIDRNASDPQRLRRNQQRTRTGAVSADIKVNAPLSTATGKIGLSLDTNGGLETSSSLLRVKTRDTSLTRDGSGLGLALVSGTGLSVGASGLTLAQFTGDSGAGGAVGSVPAPVAGDAAAGKFLAAGGTWKNPAQTAWATITPEADVTNTAVETLLTQYPTLSPAVQTVGRFLTYRAAGQYQAAVGQTLTVRVKLGATVLATFTVSLPASAVNVPFVISCALYPLTAGAGGTAGVDGFFFAGGMFPVMAAGSGAVNTTIANDLRVSVQWGGANAANHFVVNNQILTLE